MESLFEQRRKSERASTKPCLKSRKVATKKFLWKPREETKRIERNVRYDTSLHSIGTFVLEHI